MVLLKKCSLNDEMVCLQGKIKCLLLAVENVSAGCSKMTGCPGSQYPFKQGQLSSFIPSGVFSGHLKHDVASPPLSCISPASLHPMSFPKDLVARVVRNDSSCLSASLLPPLKPVTIVFCLPKVYLTHPPNYVTSRLLQ